MPAPLSAAPLFCLCALFAAGTEIIASEYYVSTGGLDTNPGTLGQPWRTVQKAANTVVAGDVVNIRAGMYAERVTLNNRDGTAVLPIVFQKYAADAGAAVIDQTGVTPPTGTSALLLIQNCDHVTIQGLEFANYVTAGNNMQKRAQLPSGIYVTGDGNGIRLLNCKVHDIWQTNDVLNNQNANAFGIAVYGTSSTAINNLTIDGCEVYGLRTGASESLVLNGNVTKFAVSNNLVHDNNNIGIDIIGYEGTGPPSLDRARDGVVTGNTVYNIDSSFNPAYGGNFTTGGGERSAAGIYVDGGTNVVIERNHVFRSNFGIELASENAAGFTDYITLRNNLLHHNHIAGIIMGGYDRLRGQTKYCSITGNTIYRNDTDASSTGQIALQFYISDCSFRNNIVWANSTTKQLWLHYPGDNQATPPQKEIGANVTLDYNRYFCSTGSATDLEFGVFKNGQQRYFATLTAWKTNANSLLTDANSTFSTPGFATATPSDPPAAPTTTDLQNIHAQFALLAASTAVNAGDPAYVQATCEKDFFAQGRIANGRVDIGADEFMAGWQQWRDQHFGLPDGGTNAEAGDDPDGDQATNLIEYSQGMNPNTPDAHLLPTAARSGGNFRFTYRKAATDATYTVQQNTALPGTWTTLSTTESTDGLGLFWRESPLNGASHFFRLKVTTP